MISNIAKFYYVYVLVSKRDKNFYVGYAKDLKSRFEQHSKGQVSSTKDRRPLELVYCRWFDAPHEAIRWEKQIQGWSRKKKEALIRDDWDSIRKLVMNKKNREKHARNGASTRASTGEDSSVACHP